MRIVSVGGCLRMSDSSTESASSEEDDHKSERSVIGNDAMCRICLILILGLEGAQASSLL